MQADFTLTLSFVSFPHLKAVNGSLSQIILILLGVVVVVIGMHVEFEKPWVILIALSPWESLGGTCLREARTRSARHSQMQFKEDGAFLPYSLS